MDDRESSQVPDDLGMAERPDAAPSQAHRAPPLSTTMDLFAHAQDGHPSAFDRLFRRLLPSVERWARGRLPGWARRRMDTADLVQEAFLNLFHRRPRVEPRRERALRAYLLASIQNRIRDEIRRAGLVEVSAPLAELAATGREASPLEQAVAQQEEERFRAALSRLSPSDQALIVGRLDLGYSYEQLALALKKRSPDAARVAVRRALLRLAEELDPARA